MIHNKLPIDLLREAAKPLGEKAQALDIEVLELEEKHKELSYSRKCHWDLYKKYQEAISKLE